jgi:hypothetical protein
MFIVFVLVGDLIGGVLGAFLRPLAPEGALRETFLTAYSLGITPPFTLDLHLLTFTVGFTLEVTLFSLIGILLAIYTFTQL